MDIDFGPPYYEPSNPPPPICQSIGRYIIHSSLNPEPSHYSYIYICSDTVDKKKKVIKFIKHIEKRKECTKNEIEIMRTCSHPNIIKMEDVFRYNVYICIVMPYAPHRSVWAFLQQYYPYGIYEDIAKRIFDQMLQAVRYLHEISAIHRDIKPENFLVFLSPLEPKEIENDENDLYCLNFDINSIKIVLIDFGFARFFLPNEKFQDYMGTFEYMAPEIINNNEYDKAVDVWALGITLFILLTNRSPYPSTRYTYNKFMAKAEKGEINMRLLDLNNISDEAKDLIINLCRFNPSERFSVSDAISHVWVKSQFEKTDIESNISSAIGLAYDYQSDPLS